MLYFSLFHPDTFTWIFASFIIFSGAGYLLIPKNLILGAIFSYLVLAAATAAAYMLCHVFELGTLAFWCVTVVITGFVSWCARPIFNLAVFELPKKNTLCVSLLIVTSISIIVYFGFLATIAVTEASAGTQFFQAWNPLFASHIGSTGTFSFPADANLQKGMLTYSDYYSANTRGIIIALALLGVVDVQQLFYAYNALSILATSLTFAILLQTVISQKSILPGFLFIIFMVYFSLTDLNTRMVFVSNFSDEVLYLASAGLLFVLLNNYEDWNIARRLQASVIFSAFMVVGRNYGLAWLGVLSLAYFYVSLYEKDSQASIVRKTISFFFDNWKIVTISFIIAIKEIVQIVLYGINFPRNEVVSNLSYSIESIEAAIISGFNIFYISDGYLFNIHSLYIFILIICIALFSFHKARISQYFIIFLPLTFLAFPVILELFLQYRKSPNFNKLYVPVMFFTIWYSAWCVKFLLDSSAVAKRPNVILVSGIFVLVCIVGFFQIESEHRYRKLQFSGSVSLHQTLVKDRLVGQVRYKRHEELLVERLVAKLPDDELKNVIERPVMYFHFEPGLGYRYFAGGDIGNDFDYFGKSTPAEIENYQTAHAFLCSKGMPNILTYLINGEVPYFKYYPYHKASWMDSGFIQSIEDAGYRLEAKAHGLQLYVQSETTPKCVAN